MLTAVAWLTWRILPQASRLGWLPGCHPASQHSFLVSQGQAGLRDVGSLGAGQALLVHGPLVSALSVRLSLFALPVRVLFTLPTLATFEQ